MSVKFKINKPMISDVIDMFGRNVRFLKDKDGDVIVQTKANEGAMIQFAKSFSPDVVVLEPQSLVETISEELRKSYQIYASVIMKRKHEDDER